ncbi:MAG: PAS domain S-box protein [Deltaproteobacteria bacterium]|nr:PAS domain S-box protein [Deltaproteobacteria bacterium]
MAALRQKWLWTAVLCAAALAVCPWAWASPVAAVSDANAAVNLSPFVDVLEDPAGELSWSQVQKPPYSQAFVPAAANGFSMGYSNSAWWARVRVRSDSPVEQPWMLEIAFPSLDDVQLFFADAEGRPVQRQSGAQHRHRQGEFYGSALVFRVPVGSTPRTLWLRVASRSAPVTVPMTLRSEADFPRAMAARGWKGGAVIGVCAALVLGVLVIAFMTGASASLWMIFHMLGVGGMVVAVDGMGLHLPTELGGWWFRHDFLILQSASVLGALLYSRAFLPGGSLCRCAPVLTTLGHGVVAVTVLAASITEPWSQATAQLTNAVAMLLLLGVTGRHVLAGAREPRWLLAAWTCATLGVWASTSRRFGWLPLTDTFHSLHGYLEGAGLLLLAASFADLQAQAVRRLAAAENESAKADAALRAERRDRVRTVLSDTPYPVLLVETGGAIAFANRALCTMLGYDASELEGRPVEDLAPPAVRAEHIQMRQSYAENHNVQPMLGRRDLLAVRKDGSPLPVAITLVPYTVEGTGYMLASIQDVSEQRSAQTALQISEQRFRNLADNLPGAVYREPLDAEGSSEYLSKGMSALLGRPMVAGDPDLPRWRDFVHGDDWQRYHDALARQLATGEPLDIEHRIVRPDGTIRWVHNVAVLSSDATGQPRYRDGRLIDVTDRRKALAELEEQRSLLQAIIDSLDGALAVTDQDGRFLTVNHKWEAYRGVTRALVMGHSVASARGSGVLPNWREVVVKVEQLGEVRVVELESVRDSSPRTFRSTISPLRDDTGALRGTCAYSVDVTTERTLQRDLAAAHDAALAASRSKSAFIANMSHEIRTPMNAILGFADLLAQRLADEEARSHAEIIASSGRALLRLIDDVLDLAKVEAGKMELQPVVLHLPSMLADLERLLRPRAAGKGVALRLEIDPAVPADLIADETRLRQVLLNLLSNAIKFTDHGHVKLTVSRADTPEAPGSVGLCFEVSDTGIGVAPEQQARIFEAFEQSAGQDHAKYGGTGLGLSITRRIVELMSGRITLQSVPGQGSTFTVLLPAVEVSASSARPGPLQRQRRERFVANRVLIVDDSAPNRHVFREYLRDTGLTVQTAGDGEEALQIVRSERPALVVTDLVMPGLSGEDLIARLRGDATTAKLPIVVLTASGIHGSHSGVRAVVDGFVLKPVTRADLLAELARHLPLAPDLPGATPQASTAVTTQASQVIASADGSAELLQELRDEWATLHGSGDLDGIASFADKVIQFGQRRHDPLARRFGRRLSKAAADCALDEIERSMREFEALSRDWQMEDSSGGSTAGEAT